ncbi:MAG TPA: YCF48-related protein [Pirellulales bacterium]|nr:YCF48-related protein [Pirellulales bacterium]
MSRARWLGIAVFGIALIVLAPWGASADGPIDAMRADARLRDVCFVSQDEGWAVGDRGVIWHTDDGGRQWNLQSSGVDCSLACVYFLDADTGWAVGGSTQPYIHTSQGVVLRTRDGGRHWSAARQGVLPALERIRFFDATHGWALGRASAIFPSGVVATDDGGRSWSALTATDSRSWLTGDFIDRDTGALAGRASNLATIRQRGVELAPADFGLRSLARMKLVAPAGGWLVGEGGLILKTVDLGKTWQTTEPELPKAVRDHFDFAALDVHGSHCWVAGVPGTRVLHSGDGGRSWQLGDTAQSLPINALAFANEHTGWAVGELGTILATADGGQTWQKQRGGGARAAFVGFFGRPGDMPLELIARLSAEDGYLGAMEILCRDDVDAPSTGALDPVQAAHEASVLAGASGALAAWRFPLRQSAIKLSAEQLVEGWNRANDSGALEKLEAHVVARTRTWRPSVVFTSSVAAAGNDPLGQIINQVVLRAVERAADATQYPDQISEAGLQPWRVQKLYAALPSGQGGASSVNTAQLAARLGRSVGEWAAPARGVIGNQYKLPESTIGFRLLVDHIPQEQGKRDFFAGIPLAPGGEARRRFEEVPDRSLDAMRREAQMRRNLQAILSAAESDGREGRFLADISSQTRSMQGDRGAEVLFQLGHRYFAHGKWELTAESYDLIVERHIKQPLAGAALQWLVQFYASGEAAWRTRAPRQVTVASTTTSPPAIGRRVPPTAGAPASEARPGAVIAATHVERAAKTIDALRPTDDGRPARANEYAKQLEAFQPALFNEPAVRFALAAAHREQGLPRQADRYFLGLRHSRPHDAWWTCAQSELWLAEPKGPPPKELWNCAQAPSKPRLDGQLDDPLWQSAARVELRSAARDDADWQAMAMLAYDQEYLYIGIHCSQAPGFKYVASDQPRPRDPDLSDQDRVELSIDLDRDFSTYYTLVIDHRGWTGERCWGDKSWNPDWFVASAQSDGAWTAEAAIPLAELTGQPPAAKSAWAVGVQRIVPGVGFQSWTTPAAAETIPEGFGILIFK